MKTTPANEIVHIALVLDASGSMNRLSSKVVEMADRQIHELKTSSEQLNLETRVSVYTFSFARDIQCLIFDKDVFRLPSIQGLYYASGQTALIDATIKSQHDLAATCQLYGKHHFRTYVWTDGVENDSRNRPWDLQRMLERQGPNWSVAVLVPDETAKQRCLDSGFVQGNVLIWDVSAQGMEEAAEKVSKSTQSYMTSVSRGIAYDKNNVFGTGEDKVNAQTVQALTPVTPGSFVLWDVFKDERIDEFVRRHNNGKFSVGRGFYELTGRMVTIQANKEVMIVDRATSQAYGGDEVRRLLGLGGTDVRVKAEHNAKYKVFVKSTANNRKLLTGTQLLYLR